MAKKIPIVGEYPYNLILRAFKDEGLALTITETAMNNTLEYMKLCESWKCVEYLEGVYRLGADEDDVLSDLWIPKEQRANFKSRSFRILRGYESVLKRGFYIYDKLKMDELGLISVRDVKFNDQVNVGLEEIGVYTLKDLLLLGETGLTDQGFSFACIKNIKEALGVVGLELLRGQNSIQGKDGVCNLLKQYPFNLAFAMFEDVETVFNINVLSLADLIDNLDKCMLSTRERDIVLYHYRDGLSLEKVGTLLGLTGSRIQQIRAKILRKLRHKSRLNEFKMVSYSEYREVQLQLSDVVKENNRLLGVVKKFTVVESLNNGKEYKVDALTIYDLGLSTRTVNCLKRYGKTDLVEVSKMTIDELYSIRNIGKGSVMELTNKLSEYGILLKGSLDTIV